jgi:hypothetical protein
MPAESAKQERFMQAVANNPKFAKKVGVSQSVGKEFTKAGGGAMKSEMKKVASTAVKGHEKRMHGAAKGGAMKMAAGGKMDMVNKGGKMVPAFAADGKGKMAKGGAMKMAKGGKMDGCAVRGKTKGTMVTMAKGGKMYKKGGRAC